LLTNKWLWFQGCRQVGKTTLACNTYDPQNIFYFNWDDFDDRELLLRGENALAQHIGLNQLKLQYPLIILDEIHKFPQWKQLVKGFYGNF